MAGHTSVGENDQRGQGGWTWLNTRVWEKMTKEGREGGHGWTHECGRK